ncbi:hypothetical protein G9A89_013096 [Geosiphon pyriformis]|nr:hypothetical protein G9A89_013096 [Geosiphon pyriformis]
MLSMLRCSKPKIRNSKPFQCSGDARFCSNSLTQPFELLAVNRKKPSQSRINFPSKGSSVLDPLLQQDFSSSMRHQSTTTAEPAVSSIPISPVLGASHIKLYNAFDTNDSSLIILPEPSVVQKEAGTLIPVAFNERLAILYACLQSGYLERATRVFQELWSSSTSEMKNYLDINIHNAFLTAITQFEPENLKKAYDWLDLMKKKYGIIPDLGSYVSLIKGSLRNSEKRSDVIFFYVEDMLRNNIATLDKLLTNSYFSDEEVNALTEEIEKSNFAAKDWKDLVKEMKRKLLLPEPVDVDARGVKLMKEALSAAKGSYGELMTRQMKLEENAYKAAMERWKNEDDLPKTKLPYSIRKLMWDWHQKLVPLIEEELKKIKGAGKRMAKSVPSFDENINTSERNEHDRQSYGLFLQLLKADKLSAITILEILRLQGTSGIIEGMKSATALIAIGQAVENEYNAEQMKKRINRNMIGRNINLQELYSSGKLFQMAIRRAQAKLEHEAAATQWNPKWSTSVKAKIGSVLTSLLINCAKVTTEFIGMNELPMEQEVPAFYHTYQYIRGKQIGVIKLYPALVESLSREGMCDTIHPRMLPMLVPPKPWLTYKSGGYYTTETLAMRIKGCPEQREYLKKASENEYLTQVFTGLDVLGSTEWSVNKAIYKLVLEIWNSGEPLAGIPPATVEIPQPPQPKDFKTNAKARMEWLVACQAARQKVLNNHSERCAVNYKVQIAGAFLDDAIYFPHSLDFRGRAYAIPPHFNHLGDDLCRGLLVFKEAKPLGPEGYRWLKIHLANLCGVDKISLEDRERFVEENMDDVIDSAENPLKGRKWWLKAEDPWQCLAVCIDIAAASKCEDPTKYESRIPVHQDGTCNGLQHYAALGGDSEGAKQVNLDSSEIDDKPADIYTGVAERVTAMIQEDANKGDPLAQLAVNLVNRKVVKQTVMTNVYGVTYVGARIQIANRLRDRHDMSEEDVQKLSSYITKKVFSCLSEMFHGARKIQDWLHECAKKISKSIPREVVYGPPTGFEDVGEPGQSKTARKSLNQSQKMSDSQIDENDQIFKQSKIILSPSQASKNQMTAVVWTTPLNLPIVQPYRKLPRRPIRTNLQNIIIEDPNSLSPVNSIKQAAAFPPNFIHSLDATHMLLSAIACENARITFASVHDSYWTHACDVPTLNKILREQFVRLHSKPIMENLRKEFIQRYKDYVVPPTITKKPVQNLQGNLKESFIGEAIEDRPIQKDNLTSHSTDNSKTGFLDELSQLQDFPINLSDKPVAEFVDEISIEESLLSPDSKSMTMEDATDINIQDNWEEIDQEGTDEPTSKNKSQKKLAKPSRIWEVLTFPPLPPKGDFDVSKVKDSKYFFH